MLRNLNSLCAFFTAAYPLLALLLAAPVVHGQANAWRISDSRQSVRYVVTVHDLRHNVPRAARAEMERAEKARRKHNTDEEVAHLRKVIAIDPECVAARNNLAISLMVNDAESAIAQLREAIKIDPNQPVLFSNLAAAYFALDNLNEAEDAARTAKGLGLTDFKAKLLLGWVLIEEKKYTAEAFGLVKSAIEEYPIAYLLTARILAGQGRSEQAKSHICDYLSTGDEEYRDYAERWLDYIANMEQQSSRKEFAQEATISPVGPAGTHADHQ